MIRIPITIMEVFKESDIGNIICILTTYKTRKPASA